MEEEGGPNCVSNIPRRVRQRRGGLVFPLVPSQGPVCPVGCASALLAAAAGAGRPQGAPLFMALGPHGGSSRSLTQPLGREFLAKALVLLGLPRHAYTFHSFRRGGCSLAFGRGAAESDLARHGDWRSTAIREYYPATAARQRVAGLLSSSPPLSLA